MKLSRSTILRLLVDMKKFWNLCSLVHARKRLKSSFSDSPFKKCLNTPFFLSDWPVQGSSTNSRRLSVTYMHQ